MIQKQHGSGRRILSFPAVHPCDSIAPTTLLTSLINLAHSICSWKPKCFASNARNARETVRQISNLLVFLEEVRVLGSDLPDSVVLGFSELHLTLQKVQYLIDDCCREGAHLWLLMKSERVANQFRVLSRAMATCLDVLPLGYLDVSDDAKEVAELVMKQARKGKFEVEPDDKTAMKEVMSILSQFENGVVPDRDYMKRVLESVGITKWSDCNDEVKFLDAEIEFEYTNGEKRREISLLSSLMGFMIYSRCVVFDSVDSKPIQQLHTNSKCYYGEEVLRCLNSDDFRCPISLEVMKDPVAIETGHTYDRSSILKWFRAGNPTCPKTGNKLTSTVLVPNLALKQLIHQYCHENRVPIAVSSHKTRDITWTIVAGSLAAEGAKKMVAGFLAERLKNGDSEARSKGAYEIRLLSKTSIFNRSCLVDAGVIPYLLELLLSKDWLSQDNAIAGLLNLSKHSKGKAAIVGNGGLELIVSVLKNGLKVEARQHAAAILFYLASIEEYRKLIGENTEAIPVLVDMIVNGSDRSKKNALVAIYGLLMHPCNHRRVLAAGTVPLLLSLLTSTEIEDLVTDALAVLASLAEKPEGAKGILSCGALPQIVVVLDSSTSRAAKEHWVCLLLALCINGGADVVGFLVKSPSLMRSLYSLLTEGTSRASKKASALLRVLHEFYERSSSASKTPVVHREQFIRAW